jgi:hypothetical protein
MPTLAKEQNYFVKGFYGSSRLREHRNSRRKNLLCKFLGASHDSHCSARMPEYGLYLWVLRVTYQNYFPAVGHGLSRLALQAQHVWAGCVYKPEFFLSRHFVYTRQRPVTAYKHLAA